MRKVEKTKKILVIVLVVFLIFVLVSLMSHRQKIVGMNQKPQAAAVAQKPPVFAYTVQMSGLIDRAKNILNGKFMYQSKVNDFFPKKNTFGNAAAVNFFSAQKTCWKT